MAGQQGSPSSAPAHTLCVLLFGLCMGGGWWGCAVLGLVVIQGLSVHPQPICCCDLVLGGHKMFITIPLESQQRKGRCEQSW